MVPSSEYSVGYPGVDDGCRVDCRCIHGQEDADAVGEDALGDGEEDDAAHGVTEEHEGCAGGGVAFVEVVLEGCDGLLEVSY